MSVLRNRSLTPAVILLVGLLTFALLRAAGYAQPVNDIATTALAPLQYGLNWVGARITDWTQTLRDLRSLQARARELEETVDRLMIENVRLREAEIERANLRELLQFKQANPSYEPLAAEVHRVGEHQRGRRRHFAGPEQLSDPFPASIKSPSIDRPARRLAVVREVEPFESSGIAVDAELRETGQDRVADLRPDRVGEVQPAGGARLLELSNQTTELPMMTR